MSPGVAVCAVAAALAVVVFLPRRRPSPLDAGAGGEPGTGEDGLAHGARRPGALLARALGAVTASRWWPGSARAAADAETVAVAELASSLASLLVAGVGPAPAWQHAAASTSAATGGARVGGGRSRGAAAVARATEAGAVAARGGDDVAAVLRAQAASSPGGGRGLHALAAAWQVAAATGAPTAGVLRALARALEAEHEQDDATAAAMAGPRASALVLAGLPLAGLGLGALMGVDPLAVLVGTVAGRWCAVVGLGCAGGGWWWTSRLVAAAGRVR